MALKKGYKKLIEEANAEVKSYTVAEVKERMQKGDSVIVDIRDIRELEKQGKLPDALHAPRGMLEFWVDPESPYHREVFAQKDKEYILYCASSWRSALATKALQDMGMENVAHITGGFGAWKEAGETIEEHKKKVK